MTEDELDDAIHEWHESEDDPRELWEFLGWTYEQYRHWFNTGEQPENPGPVFNPS